MNTDFRMSKTWCAIFNADSSKPKLSKMEQSFLVQWLWILCAILSNTNENVLRNCDKIPNPCQHVSSCITVLAEMEEFWMCLWYVLESYGSSLTKHQKWNWQTSSECIRICKISLTDYLVFFFSHPLKCYKCFSEESCKSSQLLTWLKLSHNPSIFQLN